MAASPPVVSVVLPSYNHEHYVEAAVTSVLSQSFNDLELIAWDDGSSDGSLDRLRSLADTDPRLRVRTHDGNANHGLARTLRAAVEESTGSHLAVIASDDRWLPQRLERMLELMPGRDAVYALAYVIDEKGDRTGATYGRAPDQPDLFEQLLLQNVIPAPCVLMTRAAYDAVGGYDLDAPYEDLHLMVRLAGGGRFGFLPEPVADYRISSSGLHQETERRAGRFAAIARTLAGIDPQSLPAEQQRRRLADLVAAWQWMTAWEEPGAAFPSSARGASDVPRLVSAWQLLLPETCTRDRQLALVRALGRRDPVAAARVLATLVRRRRALS